MRRLRICFSGRPRTWLNGKGQPRLVTAVAAVVPLAIAAALLAGPGQARPKGSSHTGRALNECIRDLAGSGQYGTLNGFEFYLGLYSINKSTWYGNAAYFARRRDSNYTETWVDQVYNGGNDEYGTSGNTTRYTTIQPFAGSMTSWSVAEYAMC
jgi:hypothetical protein